DRIISVNDGSVCLLEEDKPHQRLLITEIPNEGVVVSLDLKADNYLNNTDLLLPRLEKVHCAVDYLIICDYLDRVDVLLLELKSQSYDNLLHKFWSSCDLVRFLVKKCDHFSNNNFNYRERNVNVYAFLASPKGRGKSGIGVAYPQEQLRGLRYLKLPYNEEISYKSLLRSAPRL
ncbi:hypothetical protein WDZ92_54380, partial [Nostoc sp. NIES-2111]